MIQYAMGYQIHCILTLRVLTMSTWGLFVMSDLPMYLGCRTWASLSCTNKPQSALPTGNLSGPPKVGLVRDRQSNVLMQLLSLHLAADREPVRPPLAVRTTFPWPCPWYSHQITYICEIYRETRTCSVSKIVLYLRQSWILKTVLYTQDSLG